MPEDTEAVSKIGLPEQILVALCIFILGLLDIVLPLIGPVVDLFFTQVYLRLKHMRGEYQAWMAAANGLSFLDSVLPIGDLFDPLIDTVTYLFLVHAHNNPSSALAQVEKVGAVAGKIEGALEGEEVPEGGAPPAGAGAEGPPSMAEGEAQARTEAQPPEGAQKGKPEAGEEKQAAPAARGVAAVEPSGAAGTEEATEGEEAAPGGEMPKREIPPEALGEELPPMEKAKEELVGEKPVTEKPAAGQEEEAAKAPKETEAQRKAREAQERAAEISEKMKRIVPKEEEGGEERGKDEGGEGGGDGEEEGEGGEPGEETP